MVDLKTTYLGMELKNPVIAGASSLTSNLKAIEQIEEAGAGAIVLKSLFEEQIEFSSYMESENLEKYNDWHAEMTSVFPSLKYAGVQEHLLWVKKTKELVKIPVIASLNAVEKETWIEYAKKLEDTGVDALELNFYALPEKFDISSHEIEQRQLDIVEKIKKKIKIPISAKISHFYTAPLSFIAALDDLGIQGVVLFNRLFHPDIDVKKEINDLSFNISGEGDHRLALRFCGLLFDKIKASISASNGILSYENAVAAILAGADTVQVVSILYKDSISAITKILNGMETWMNEKKYSSLGDFQGKFSLENNPDKWTYTRAKYITALRKSGQFMKR